MKNYTKEKFKTKSEWLNNRGLGGSGASALLNANPYQSALDIYCASVNTIKVDNEQSEMFNGIFVSCENGTKTFFEVESNIKNIDVINKKTVFINCIYPPILEKITDNFK